MVTKKGDCIYCDGKGYNVIGNEYSGYSDDKCHMCEGSGKLIITSTEHLCTECNGDKKVRYYKDNYNPSMSLFGNASEKEKKAWDKKFTVLKTCQKCNGSGKELHFEDSKPASKGWF